MQYDVIVVGGGIVGCTHAYYLGKLGLRVAVLEKGRIAQGTTANNFSWINGSTKVQNEGYHRLNALGVQMHGDLAKEFGAALIGQNPRGALGHVCRSDTTLYQAMRTSADALAGFDYPVRWIDTDELRQLEPHVDFEDDAEAMFTSSDKCLNAIQFTNFIVDQLRQLGGEILENCLAIELNVDDAGRPDGVSTPLGDFHAPRVVIATGPDTPQVLSDLTGYDGFAARFPVSKVPGLLLTTPPVADGLVRHLNYTDRGGEFHFMPDFNGGLRLASDDVDGAIVADQSPTHLRHLAIGLLNRTQSLIPEFGGNALIDDCQLAIGVRAYPADGHSIAGQLPGSEGIFIIATHSGVTLAPALGSLMAELVAKGTAPPMLRPFGLQRLAGFAT